MREIKFRAWDKQDHRYWNFKEMEDIGISIFGDEPEMIIEQYTGLKDKNGKEIYEGDVLVIPDEFGTVHRISAVFKNGCFVDSYYHWSISRQSKAHQREIIGNIHENPELFECSPQ